VKHLYFQGVLISVQFLVPSTRPNCRRNSIISLEAFGSRNTLVPTKEVERSEEVSSDSDSEDACNYRFVKKVNGFRNLVRTSLWTSLVGTKVFLDPKASSEIIEFLRQFGLVDGTRNWTEIKTP
jgi:hypothetical protein